MSFDVGERIREFRKQAGLNQDQLAELSSLNRVTVAKYESGKVEPVAKALSRIADALEVSVDVLLGRSTDETQPAEQDEAWAIREHLRRDPAYRLLFDAADSEGRAFESRRAHQRNRWKQTLPAVFSCAWAR